MSEIIDIGAAIISSAERRLGAVAQNVSNVQTPGYKREIPFTDFMGSGGTGSAIGGVTGENAMTSALTRFGSARDHTQATFSASDSALDLAIDGPGFFRVGHNDKVYYTRGGQFSLDPAGYLTDAIGYRVQDASGGDLQLSSARFEVLPDGTVIQDERPIGLIGVYNAPDPSRLSAASATHFAASDDAMQLANAPVIRQGLLEGSNVTLADEMLEMMAAIRNAETGAQIVQVYDTLMEQAISTFGRR